MLLYLLRHADAAPQAPSDAARELTSRGIEQAQRVGKFCAKNEILPQIIVTSPFRRAEQTARFVGHALGVEPVIAPFLASGMEPEVARGELAVYTSHNALMLVGHEPDFSRLAAELLGLPDNAHLRLRKASLTLLNVPDLAPGAATLEFSLPVKLM
ncbi:MAG: phosphohistidine phosphatase [Chthoniobacter sp.]|nr:phosphohistidine phosphatase [Chthoniobacter sp.]